MAENQYSSLANRLLDADTLRVEEDETKRQKFTETADVRVEGIDTFETEKPNKITGNPMADMATKASQLLLDNGATINTVGQYDRYGRQLGTLTGDMGQDLSKDLLEAGMGTATGFGDVEAQEQDVLTGISRAAMGLDRTTNPVLTDVAREAETQRKQYEYAPFSSNPDLKMKIMPYDSRGTFEKSWDRGTAEVKSSAGGFMNWMGDLTGNAELVDKGRAMTLEGNADAATSARSIASYQDVDSLEDGFDYALETLGEMAPGLMFDGLAAVLTGGGSVGVSVARRAAVSSVQKAAKRGLIAGPVATGFVQSVGNMENTLEARGSEDNTAAAAVSGVVGGALNVAPFAAVFGKLGRASGLNDDAIEGISNRLKDIGSTAAIAGGTEGLANTAQTLVDKTIEKIAMGDESWDINSVDMIDDMIRGIVGGSSIGASASASAHTAQKMMKQYNAARESAATEDAQGDAVDEQGWKESSSIVEEVAEVDPAFSDRVTKAFTSKKPKSEYKESDIVGLGAFDGKSSKSVPNLQKDRYDEVRELVEPEGKPVNQQELGRLVDGGQLTEMEIAQYAADDHYGRNTPVSGQYDTSVSDTYLSEALRMTVEESRSGKLKLTDAQRDQLVSAEESRDVGEVRAALNNINPGIVAAVNEQGQSFDGRRMFKDYSERKSIKAQRAAPKVEAEPTEKPKPRKKLSLTKKPKAKAKEPVAKKERNVPRAEGNAKVVAEFSDKVKAIRAAAPDDAVMWRTLQRLKALDKEGGKGKEAMEIVNLAYKNLKQTEADAAFGEVKTVAAKAETRKDAPDRNIGDVQQETPDFDTRSDQEVRESFRKRTGYSKVIMQKLYTSKVFSNFNKAKLLPLFKALNKPTEREELAGNLEEGFNATLPVKLEVEGSTPETTNRATAKGARQERITKKISNKTLKALRKKVEGDDVEGAIQILEGMGIVGDITGMQTVMGESQLSDDQQLQLLVKRSRPLRRIQGKERTGRANRQISIKDADGKKTYVDGDLLTRWGMKQNGVDLDDSAGYTNLQDEIFNGLTTGLAALNDVRGEDGAIMFSVEAEDLSPSTVVYRMSGAKGATVTYGTILESRAYKARTKDNTAPQGKAIDDWSYEERTDKDYAGDASKFGAAFEMDARNRALSLMEKDGTYQAAVSREAQMNERGSEAETQSEFENRAADGSGSRDALIRTKKPKDTRPKTQGRKLQLERKMVRTVKRHRGKARESIFKFLQMTKTRLNAIHPELGDKVDKYSVERRINTEKFIAKLGNTFKSAAELQKGDDDSEKGLDTPEAKKYEAFMKEVQAHVRKYDPNFKANTTRIHLDFDKVANDRDGVINILREAKVKSPDKVVDDIIAGRGYAGWSIEPGASRPKGSGNDVLKPALDKLKEGDFVDTDAPRHLVRYINGATSWASWNEQFGAKVKGKWDSNAGYLEMESEVHAGDRGELDKLMQGVTGKLGADMSPTLRKVNSAALAVQTATVLWFSAVASIPEVAGTFARNRGAVDQLGSDVKGVLWSPDRKQMIERAQDMEIVTSGVVEHALSELYSMGDLTTGRASQWVSSKVFAMNGQNWLTTVNRALAVQMGERFLMRNAEEDSAKSKRMLEELGINAAEVKSYMDKRDINTPDGKKYRDALHRFVNESVTNPTATQLPLVANDPRFLMVTTLKKFFYGFYDNVNKGLASNYRSTKAEGGTLGEALLPIAVTGAVILPLAALAEIIREWIKYPFGRPNPKTLGDNVYNTVMATGAFGPIHIVEGIYERTGYGANPLVSALGSTAQLGMDTVSGDLKPSRLVPLVNQIPWMAQPLNEGAKKLVE